MSKKRTYLIELRGRAVREAVDEVLLVHAERLMCGFGFCGRRYLFVIAVLTMLFGGAGL